MATTNTVITTDDGRSYVVAIDSDKSNNSTVYISVEDKNDVELPLSVFRQMSRVVDALSQNENCHFRT